MPCAGAGERPSGCATVAEQTTSATTEASAFPVEHERVRCEFGVCVRMCALQSSVPSNLTL